MDNLEALVRTAVESEYSCIQEGDTVLVPCYLVTPLSISGLKGNGKNVNSTVQYEICFFVESRVKAVKIAALIQDLVLENQYACMDPQIEYERNAKAWKIIFLIEGMLERNETE